MTKNKKEEVIDEVQKAEGLEVDEIKETVESTVETEQTSEKIEEVAPVVTEKNPEEEIKPEEKTEQEEATSAKKSEVKAKSKFKAGDVVFVAKETSADLAGFKLFPQYKKYTYTVEAYDAKTEIYTLRRLNLTLKLKENDIVAPHERAENPLARKQF